MKSQAKHLRFLDGMRGFAILSVFLFHSLGTSFGTDHLAWNGWLPDFDVGRSFLALLPLTLGWIGVPVFFVISGFCIHLSHHRSPGATTHGFLIRRFFRVYPPYLIALLIFSFCYPWHFIRSTSFGDLFQFGSHLSLSHNFFRQTYFGINPAFWSIAVEFQLYLLYPLLLRMTRRIGWTNTLAALAVIEAGLRLAGVFSKTFTLPSLPYWIGHSPFVFWFSWSIGAALARDYLNHRTPSLARVPVLFFPAATVLAAHLGPLSPLTFSFAAWLRSSFLANSSTRWS